MAMIIYIADIALPTLPTLLKAIPLYRFLTVSEDNLSNNKHILIIFPHILNVTSHSDPKLINSESNFSNKDILFTVAPCTKEWRKLMTLESLNMSFTLLNEIG